MVDAILALNHRWVAGHWPEFYDYGERYAGFLPLKACLRCVKGGHPAQYRRRAVVVA